MNSLMTSTDVARWQFAITTVYHFLFVPITIGLSGLIAVLQAVWLKNRNPEMLRLVKFFGKLFTINFALGLVTGIVQEFQFGMNWSDYSRFVGDIFGAPLAIEALLAFFLESTFLGLWIFGWSRLPEKLHAACMWLVHIGTVLSAYFILAANSFMQNPVGFEVTRTPSGQMRAELTDFWAVLINKVQLVTFPHVVFSAYMSGAALVMGIGLWHVARNKYPKDRGMYRRATRFGAIAMLVASIGVLVSGDIQGKIMTEVQPMKMAAAEALYDTAESNAPFSIFTVGSLDGQEEKFAITVPHLLSYLATGRLDGKVVGINDLKVEYAQKYGADRASLAFSDSYTPIIPLTYWSFRLMMGFGFIAMAAAIVVLWLTRKGKYVDHKLWALTGIGVILFPVLANSFGWIFTEVGRQPWIVFGLMTTEHGVSPSVSVGTVWLSLIVFTLLYGALAVVEVGLMMKYTKRGADEFEEPKGPSDTSDSDELAFAY